MKRSSPNHEAHGELRFMHKHSHWVWLEGFSPNILHEPSVAAYAQEVAVLKDGRLVERFPTEGTNGGQGLALRYQESLR